MAVRLIGVDDANPMLPIGVVAASTPDLAKISNDRAVAANAVEDFNADRTGSTSAHTAFAAAFAVLPVGGKLLIPEGNYRTTATTFPGARQVELMPGATILSEGPTIFDAVGTWETAIAVTAITEGDEAGDADIDEDPADNSSRTWFTHCAIDTTGVDWESGDVVKVFASDKIPEDRVEAAGVVGRVGQFMIVDALDGTGVILHGRLRDSFTTTVKIARMTNQTASLKGGTLGYTDAALSSLTSSGSLWRFKSLRNPRVSDVNVLHGISGVGSFSSCYGYRVEGYQVEKTVGTAATAKFGYGILDTACYGGVIIGAIGNRLRHVWSSDTPRTSSGSTNPEAYGRTYGTKIIGATVESPNSTAFDCHAAAENVSFIDCTAINAPTGFGLRGKNHKVINPIGEDLWRCIEVFDEAKDTSSYGHIMVGGIFRHVRHRAVSILSRPVGHIDEGERETRMTLQVFGTQFYDCPVDSDTVNGFPVYADNATLELNDVRIHIADGVAGANPAVLRASNSYIHGHNITIDVSDYTTVDDNLALASGTGGPEVQIDGLKMIGGSSLVAAVARFAAGTRIRMTDVKLPDYTPAAISVNAMSADSYIHLYDYTPPGLDLADEFNVDVYGHAAGSVNWSAFVNSTTSPNAYLRQSSNAQNDLIVYRFPALMGGTYAITLVYRLGPANGIYTVETSVDNASWTAQTTVDSYAAAAAAGRTETTGLTIPDRTRYIRLKMATKNGTSSNYRGELCGISGYRTGA